MLSRLRRFVEKRRKQLFFIEELKSYYQTQEAPIRLSYKKTYKILVKIPFGVFDYIDFYILSSASLIDGKYYGQERVFKTIEEAEDYLELYGRDVTYPGCIERKLLPY